MEVAYLLAKAYWGQGLGTEAARGIADYAAERLHLSRLVYLITPGNEASVNVARSIGMTLEREMEDEQGSFLLYSMSVGPTLGPDGLGVLRMRRALRGPTPCCPTRC